MKRCTCLEAFGLRRTIEFHPTPQFGMEWAMGACPEILQNFFLQHSKRSIRDGSAPWANPAPLPKFPKEKHAFFAQSQERKRPETMRSPCLLLHVSQLDVRRMKPKASNVEAMRARAIQTAA